MGTPKKKQKNKITPENQFNIDLSLCSKTTDLLRAVELFDSAVANQTRLTTQNLNALLHICTAALSDPELRHAALLHGPRIFRHVSSPDEATVTAGARLAAANLDGDAAFALVKSVGDHGALPRLRTYGPALFCFAEGKQAEKAYEVEAHMAAAGVAPEEPEIAALLRVSAETGREGKVYEYLHKLREAAGVVAESTAVIVERWFSEGFRCGDGGGGATAVEDEIREAVVRNGGGWHGKGWVGEGGWVVRRGCVGSAGGSRCSCCGEELRLVDVRDTEAEKLASSVAALAMKRETNANFSAFEDWLDRHNDFEAIVDGANVALYQQNFDEGSFSVSQLDAVVKELYNRCGNKWPLIVLFNKRVQKLLENPSDKKIVDKWLRNGILYSSPSGSNDDWYWLYASVKLKCLLVTNDEMRDHIFELLGSSFFQKWKERHQVKFTFVDGNVQLKMPPPYSTVIQESEKGSWHLPIAADGNIEESERTWLCVARPNEARSVPEASQNREPKCDFDNQLKSCPSNSTELLDRDTTSSTGKRKRTSPDFNHN